VEKSLVKFEMNSGEAIYMKAIDTGVVESLRSTSVDSLLKAKNNGSKIIGMYCAYCPRELILAAGAIPIGLCGTVESSIPDAERDLPRNLCPMVKSSYGLAVTDKCPYFALSDMVIGETTCDGKKKMFEILSSKGIKPVYVMHLPQMPDTAASLDLWLTELRKLKAHLETVFHIQITDDSLRQAIHITNEENRVLQKLFDLNKQRPALISGMDMLALTYRIGFHPDRKTANRIIEQVADGVNPAYTTGDSATRRILLTGTPVGTGSEKVIKLVEESNALVVAQENCGGYKNVGLRIDENDASDPLALLAKKYMQIPCSVMSPNPKRLELIKRMAKEFQIDGVIDLTWQACHTYNLESYFVAKTVKDELGLPFLQLETDYSQSDLETLRVRIEAFLEMID
jgi:benzoyl-CoA reductase/2-hydroxyglutaryl-CoA dehydratase subunit BcrC/BadD/HgdB